jgi:GMP synthase-like glutamine amidotransferase
MEDVLVFQHDALEGLGIFTEVLEKHDLTFRYVSLSGQDDALGGWEDARALVFLGGPMAVYEEDRYPFLKWEKSLIRSGIKRGIPMLGVCLGAQLIAAAAGAEVYHGNFKEVGWYPISMTVEGQVDSLLGYLPESLTVFQWHEDGFDLPQGAQRLASSVYYGNQAFRIGKRIYGLQFHLEVTPAIIDRWMDLHWRSLAQIPHVSLEKIKADTHSYAERSRYYGERFFTEFIRRVLTQKKTKS